jgi:hypothetical protein
MVSSGWMVLCDAARAMAPATTSCAGAGAGAGLLLPLEVLEGGGAGGAAGTLASALGATCRQVSASGGEVRQGPPGLPHKGGSVARLLFRAQRSEPRQPGGGSTAGRASQALAGSDRPGDDGQAGAAIIARPHRHAALYTPRTRPTSEQRAAVRISTRAAPRQPGIRASRLPASSSPRKPARRTRSAAAAVLGRREPRTGPKSGRARRAAPA